MAINLLSKPNVITSDPAHPFGLIKDAPNGTPVNQTVYADVHTFLAKMMSDAGIAWNGQLDSATNGYQLNQALAALISPPFIGTGITYESGWANLGGANYGTEYKIDGNEVSLSGNAYKASPGTGNIDMLTLPIAARPAYLVYVPTMAVVNSTITTVIVRIQTNGKVSTNISSNVYHQVHFEGVRYRIS